MSKNYDSKMEGRGAVVSFAHAYRGCTVNELDERSDGRQVLNYYVIHVYLAVGSYTCAAHAISYS